MSGWEILGLFGGLVSLAGNIAWIWTIIEEKRDERWVRKMNMSETLSNAEDLVVESHEVIKRLA